MELRRIDLPDAAAAMVLGLGLSQIRRRLLHPYMKFTRFNLAAQILVWAFTGFDVEDKSRASL